MDESHGPPEAVSDRWQDLMDDTDVTAAEYRDDGYETLAVHTGDVVPLPERLIIDVLAPGDEFRQLTAMADGATVDEFELFTASEGDVEFALVVATDEQAEIAVCIPLFVHQDVVDAMGPRAKDAGHVDIHVRPLSDETHVVFTLEEPELLFSATAGS